MLIHAVKKCEHFYNKMGTKHILTSDVIFALFPDKCIYLILNTFYNAAY